MHLPSDPAARRAMREAPDLTAAQAGQLLAVVDDARSTRRDASMRRVVALAELAAVVAHAQDLAAGAAAGALWDRLSSDPLQRDMTARQMLAGDDLQAAETTLHLLVLDPLDAYGLGDRRAELALAALGSAHHEVRALAMEYLTASSAGVAAVMARADDLVLDDDAQVRGLAWQLTLAHDPDALDRALTLVSDEQAPLAARRSALVALGNTLRTSSIAPILAWFVQHPTPELASDAAALLANQHRHPEAAEAALHSPHEHVRDTARRLLDPLSGSPAAGGSRPGSPDGSDGLDIYRKMVALLEAAERQPDDEQQS